MKKLFSVLMTLCAALSMLAICNATVFAASDELTLKVNSVETVQGNTATISISLSNNPGINYIKLKVAYDGDAMSLKSISNQNLIDDAAFQSSRTIDKNPYY